MGGPLFLALCARNGLLANPVANVPPQLSIAAVASLVCRAHHGAASILLHGVLLSEVPDNAKRAFAGRILVPTVYHRDGPSATSQSSKTLIIRPLDARTALPCCPMLSSRKDGDPMGWKMRHSPEGEELRHVGEVGQGVQARRREAQVPADLLVQQPGEVLGALRRVLPGLQGAGHGARAGAQGRREEAAQGDIRRDARPGALPGVAPTVDKTIGTPNDYFYTAKRGADHFGRHPFKLR